MSHQNLFAAVANLSVSWPLLITFEEIVQSAASSLWEQAGLVLLHRLVYR